MAAAASASEVDTVSGEALATGVEAAVEGAALLSSSLGEAEAAPVPPLLEVADAAARQLASPLL